MSSRRSNYRIMNTRSVANSNSKGTKNEPQPLRRRPDQKPTSSGSSSEEWVLTEEDFNVNVKKEEDDSSLDSTTDSASESDDEKPLKKKKFNPELERDETILIKIDQDDDDDEEQPTSLIEIDNIVEKQNLKGKIAELQARKTLLEAEVLRYEKESRRIDRVFEKRNACFKRDRSLLRKTFSNEQVHIFLDSVKHSHGYNDDDKAIAWTITNLMFDRRGDEYIKRHMKIPFPARSSVNHWRYGTRRKKPDKKKRKPILKTEIKNEQKNDVYHDDDIDIKSLIEIKEEQ